MKKFIFFLLFLFGLGFTIYTLKNAPSKLNQVELCVENGIWREEIAQYLVGVIHPGETISPALIDELERKLNSLPWVKTSSVDVLGDKVVIKVQGVPPSYSILFRKELYLIGENGFVLQKGKEKVKGLKVFFYKGKNSPFYIERGFLKVRKTVKMEIELVKNRMRGLNFNCEEPQVILNDGFVTLIFRNSKVIVYLGAEERSWDNYQKFTSLADRLKPGIYDFRFYDMLARGGDNGH